MQYGVIMAGGAGTRLWPMSRGDKPKQLLNVVQGKSLLRLSFERLEGFLPPERIFVCMSAAHTGMVREHIPELPPENLFGEPEGRDTAAAVGFPASILHKRDKDAVAAFLTADHVIEPIDEFQGALRRGFELVSQMPEALVTFGIIPTHGHTGMGYIQRGEALSIKNVREAYRVLAYKEKPDKPTADRYVESGRYYWNSGMFVWRCDTVLSEMARHLPEVHVGLGQIANAWDTPQRDEVLRRIYPTLRKISVDYGIMEPASQNKGKARVVVVEMPVRWLDVGSWPALADTLPSDEHDNTVECGACVLVDSDGNIVVSNDPQHLVAAIGISDMIVVHTPDATLICPKTDAERVKELVMRVREKFGGKYT